MPDDVIDVDPQSTAVALATNISPMQQVEIATEQANALMQVVKKANLSKRIGNKDFLQVEAWQTIARFNGYIIDAERSEAMFEDGKKVGYWARAVLVRMSDGVRLGGADAECRFDEQMNGRPRWTDDYAVRSMAQTRAASKVGRMNFAWVAVLAGFQPTPADEVHDGMGGGGSPSQGNSNEPTFPMGHNKGKTPSELDAATLKKEVPFWTKKAGESGQYQANNQKLLAAIQAAIEAKEKPVSPGQKDQLSKDAMHRVDLAKKAAKLCGALTASGWAALETEFGLGKGKQIKTADLRRLADRLTNLSSDYQSEKGGNPADEYEGEIPF